MMKRALLLLPLLAGCRPADPRGEAAPYYVDGLGVGTDVVTGRTAIADGGTSLEFVGQVPDSRQRIMRVLDGPLKGRQIALPPEAITSDRPSPSPNPGR
jgi:hypothetical protein